MSGAGVLNILGCTATGEVREHNEDHILVGRFIKNRGWVQMALPLEDELLSRDGLLCAVADGIGGESSGEVASLLALRTLDRHFSSVIKGGEGSAHRQVLEAALHRTGETVATAAASRPDWSRMGCTLSGVCLQPGGAYLVFHVGDSRIYRWRDGRLRLLTMDDSAQRWAREAGWSEGDAHSDRGGAHLLTNWIGHREGRFHLEEGPPLRENDLLLLCSDGLHDALSEEIMESLLGQNQGRFALETLGRDLTAEAIRRGGTDNISLILIQRGSGNDLAPAPA